MDERVIYELGLSVRSLGLWTGSQSGAAAPGVATVSWMGAGVAIAWFPRPVPLVLLCSVRSAVRTVWTSSVTRTLLGRFISLPWQGKFVIQSDWGLPIAVWYDDDTLGNSQDDIPLWRTQHEAGQDVFNESRDLKACMTLMMAHCTFFLIFETTCTTSQWVTVVTCSPLQPWRHFVKVQIIKPFCTCNPLSIIGEQLAV